MFRRRCLDMTARSRRRSGRRSVATVAHSAGPAPDDGIPGAGPPTSELPTFGLPTSGLPTSGHPAVNAAARIAAEDLAPHADAADDPARGVDPAITICEILLSTDQRLIWALIALAIS